MTISCQFSRFSKGQNCCSLAQNMRFSVRVFYNTVRFISSINSCPSAISTLCAENRLKEALCVLHVIDKENGSVDCTAYASLFKACANANALPEGKRIHSHMLTTTGFRQNVFLENTLLTMYSDCGNIAEALQVFKNITKPNIFSWNTIIRGCVLNGLNEEALGLYYQMRLAKVPPDEFTFPPIIKACAALAALEQGRDVHDNAIRNGLESNIYVCNALLAMYSKCGRVGYARILFDKMRERDVVSWNAMITGYAQDGNFEEAVELFHEMQTTGVKPDMITWSAVIAGCAQSGLASEALKFFGDMQVGAHVNVDWVTIVSVLPACGDLADVYHGREIHGNVIRNGFESCVAVGNALIDMYAKSGFVNVARQVFDKMLVRNVASWSAMIGGYGMHGHGEDAITLFCQMQNAGVKPDPIAFVGVLSACSHSGLVDEGQQYFDSMSLEFNIAPVVEHYACMVDLLSRAGHLEEAHDLVKKMPVQPTASVWGALLGACRIQCNIELGEHVSERLFELQPDRAGNYVLLSNIYAAAGRWDDVTKMRTLMKDRGVRKRPGFSWIEVKNRVHQFLVADRSHPQSEEIYAMLDRLAGQMKDAGYVPNFQFVLYDME